jgi:hypothetical protein
VTEEKMKAMAQFSYDELGIKIVIGVDIALQTEKGTNKLSMSAKNWHWSVCRALLNNYVKILNFAMPLHVAGEKDERRFSQAVELWEVFFFFFNDVVTRGCDNGDAD